MEQDPCAEHSDCFDPAHRITVVHGACPTGADAMADRWARTWGVSVERHPAHWDMGRGAGFVRNEAMVELGADVCLAFIRQASRGATHCADLAEAAGIKTIRYLED